MWRTSDHRMRLAYRIRRSNLALRLVAHGHFDYALLSLPESQCDPSRQNLEYRNSKLYKRRVELPRSLFWVEIEISPRHGALPDLKKFKSSVKWCLYKLPLIWVQLTTVTVVIYMTAVDSKHLPIILNYSTTDDAQHTTAHLVRLLVLKALIDVSEHSPIALRHKTYISRVITTQRSVYSERFYSFFLVSINIRR